MSLDTAVRSVVRRAIHAVGTTVTFRRVTVGTYDPTTGMGTDTTTDTDIVGRLDEYLDRELSNAIQAGDRKLTVAALDLAVVPAVSDVVLIDDHPYDVVRVTREMAQDLPALYVLQLRG